MRVATTFILEREDIEKILPYSMICMSRYGAVWSRSSVQKRFKEEFTEKERKDADSIFRLAHRWLLVTGTPEEARMTGETFSLWLKLGEFCSSI